MKTTAHVILHKSRGNFNRRPKYSMDLWPENQELPPRHTRFGTVPRPNPTYTYHYHYPAGNRQERRNPVGESGYWTLPRSRIGGTLLDHTGWTAPLQPRASTSAQYHFLGCHHSQQNTGEYRSREASERTTVGQVTAGAYRRDYASEGWRRRPVEPSHLVRYGASSERRGGSYGEFEAGATRYSRSLPRMRRLEAEQSGASRGLPESRRTGIESGVEAAPQPAGQRRQKHCPPPAPQAGRGPQVIGKIQRTFSQPPGYVAPPPYNGPHKALRCSTQVERIQKPKTDLEGHRYRENPLQIVHIAQTDLTWPQTTKIILESPSKVIEGRKFRFNKRTGGMTVFCLVSRIAGPTEDPSNERLNALNTEGAECTPVSNENIQRAKVADEVDEALARTYTEQDRNLPRREVTVTRIKSDEPSNQDMTEGIPLDENKSTFERRAAPTVSVRYPLWREPSLTGPNQSPLGTEVRRPDIKKSPETEEGKDLLVNDTACVVVKMELTKEDGPTADTEHSCASSERSGSLHNTELHPDPNNELNLLPIRKSPTNGLNSETTAIESERKNATVESLEKTAERILCIDIHTTALFDVCAKDREKGLTLTQLNKSKLSKEQQQSENRQKQSTEWISDKDKSPKVEYDSFSGSHQKEFHVFETSLNCPSGTDNADQFAKTEDPSVESAQERAEPERRSAENAARCFTPPAVSSKTSSSQDPQKSDLNLTPSPIAVESPACISESETEVSPDVESVTDDPIVYCALRRGAASSSPPHAQLPVYLAEPSTLNLCPSAAMADIEVCEEEPAQKEKNSQRGELSGVPHHFPVDGMDKSAARQQLESASVNGAALDMAMDLLGQIAHDGPTERNGEQPFGIQAEDGNRSGNSEKLREFQSRVKVQTPAVPARDVHENADKDLPGLGEQAAECQSDILPTAKPSPPSPSDNKPDAFPKSSSLPTEDIAPQPETESACPFSRKDVGFGETLPALLLDCSPSLPPLDESGSDIPQGAELQYPTSLWDAVNRIRKHTAPDSENEEEEVSELWDADNVGVGLDHLEELSLLEGSEAEQMLPWREEDTPSCSSAGSRDSGETVVIIAGEEEEGGSGCRRPRDIASELV
ncbi:uncharacterized protein si:ch211-159e12.5 [Corythoichthys intestinalis]|uniref:uncharacterized protein si:ch211-159e12.5 n=1 Tax=Corythoichthys intestinalis TaxID=161448 RepID=UPI0025A563CE|nr:uncharacterized protein si:ch211-159e12.5 [Corythoichthys intestinalis]